MSQFAFTYPVRDLVGTPATTNPSRTISVLNPLNAQITNLEYNGITTDGDYSLTIVGADGSSATSDAFTASSNSAAEICAGIVAGCESNAEFAGLISDASVVTTDNVQLTFRQAGVSFTVTPTSPGSDPTQSNTTTAGYTVVAPGIILQADGSGGFSTTYSDAALALGLVLRNADLVQPLDVSATVGYDGPVMMLLVVQGDANVQVNPGITVARGQKVYFNSTTATFSNVTTGSHVLVEGAQWMTDGTGTQAAYFNFPSES